ncbi:uncharacterized protein LOC117172485 isoform X1 [Belonocnema kinseyi]|uniref:uncharacterized protein LOC117172485 isoform X1 n=1 Tax=Belonocnema kinseyi TaxID=2817044 RepID=UPI00143CE4A5|nr:uncharacterized protein LOC117172485 isoform X1 [Belonocnema kinseyi]
MGNNYITKFIKLPGEIAATLYISDKMTLLGATRFKDPNKLKPKAGLFYIMYRKVPIEVKYDPETKVISKFEVHPRNTMPTANSRNFQMIKEKTVVFCEIPFRILYEAEEGQTQEHIWSATLTHSDQIVPFDHLLIPQP